LLQPLQLSHFGAAGIFAVIASVVFGITQRSERRDMVAYGAKCFAYFILGLFAAGWVMWLLRH